MQAVFVTRKRYDWQHPNIRVVSPEEYNPHEHILKGGKSKIKEPTSYSDWYLLGYDIETKGVDPLSGQMLLSSFCNETGDTLVVDNTTVNSNEIFKPEVLKRCYFIAHNADYEARWGVVNNFLPGRFSCTMVNDKRLLSGQQGYRFDLVSVINRRLGYKAIPVWMDKDIRKEFYEHDGNFTEEQVLYNAGDTIRLISLHIRQLEEAAKINQLFLHSTINARIIIPIAKAEVTGIKHESERWINIAKDRQKRAEEIWRELNEIVVKEYSLIPGTINTKEKELKEKGLRRSERLESRKQKLQLALEKLEEKGKQHLKSYIKQAEMLIKVLRDLQVVTHSPSGSESINWGSQKQVLEVLRQMGCPMPKSKDKESHEMKEGVGKEARTNWFVNNEGSKYEPFMKKFDQFKKLQHNVKSFGVKWVEQFVRNGRVYTLLDQAGTDTGRFSSGSKGKKKEFANMQQIPAREGALYRECFVADDDRSMMTIDYTNCEGVVMTSLSGDLNMMKILSIKDSHSFLGTKCWRAVYTDRFNRTGRQEWKELAETYEMNQTSPEKKKERDTFKNSGGLFPVAYGVAAGKVAATSKIPNHEGQVMIDTIKGEIPQVIKYLDQKAKVAKAEGYVVHNTRTGSRRWFTPVLDHIHYGFPLDKSQLAEVEFASRNSPIQGTNSDLMKEAIAMIYLYSVLFKVDIRFLLTVHDEWVGDAPDDQVQEIGKKVEQLMQRAANNYLIPEIKMGADLRIAKHWKK